MSVVADESVLDRYSKELTDFCTINEKIQERMKDKNIQLSSKGPTIT